MIMLVFGIALALLLALAAIAALLPVHTDYHFSATGARQEGTLESSSGLFRLKLYAVKEGTQKEASVDLSIAGRLAIYRVDYPVVKLGRHGRWPVVQVHREVEVGTGTASPVAKEDKEYGVPNLLQAAEELRLVALSVAPQLNRLGARTQVSGVSLLVHESTGSPETTACAFGLVWGFVGLGLSVLRRNTRLADEPVVDVQPVYGQPYLVVQGSGRTSVRQGYLVAFFISCLRELWPHVLAYAKVYLGLRRLRRRNAPGYVQTT